MKPLTVILVILALSFSSCNNSPTEDNPVRPVDTAAPDITVWTEAMKASILADFEKGIDSVLYMPTPDGNFFDVFHFRNGEVKKKQYLSKDSLTIMEVFIAGAGGEFELRRKFCPNGQMAFEGITLNGEHCGMDTWWHCNGQVEHQGLRYRSHKFGKWPYWKEDGTPDHEDNFGLMGYLDSLSTIKFSGGN